MNQLPSDSEFDQFAPGYNAGMDDPLKRMGGGTAEIFLEHKAAWLQRYIEYHGSGGGRGPLRLLEFGCGTGGFLRALETVGFKAEFEGCDISAGMIDEAHRLWPTDATVPPLYHTPPGILPFADASFDIVTAVCVFHHIPPVEWAASTRELVRILKPGGRLMIFEHNPWNPATQFIVKRCPIDQNAVLLSAKRTGKLVHEAIGSAPSLHHILFFPPRWKRVWRWEHWLTRLPIGGQYVVVGQKNALSNL